MVRRALVERVGGYDESVPVAQDYDLWMRLARVTRLASLSEVVVVRRLLPARVSATRDDARLHAEARIRWRAVRDGDYPWWCAVYALRPAAARVLPLTLRRRMRRALGGAAGA
jgi:hypothetical protein